MKKDNIKAETQDELKDIAPILNAIRTGEEHAPPGKYFEELPDRVMARIAGEGLRRKGSGMVRRMTIGRRLAMAASVLILIVAGVLLMRSPRDSDILTEITAEEALQYVINNIDAYDSEDLFATVALGGWHTGEIAPVPDEDVDEMLQILQEEDIDMLLIN